MPLEEVGRLVESRQRLPVDFCNTILLNSEHKNGTIGFDDRVVRLA